MATLPRNVTDIVKVRAAGLGKRVRVRASGDDPGVVALTLTDQEIVPSTAELQGWIAAVAESTEGLVPVHTIRSGALFADAADRFAAVGFSVVDTLALLRLDLDGTKDAARPDRHTSTLRSHHHVDAARIDRAAFGDTWWNDADDLEEIRRATPRHVARARFGGRLRHRVLVGFAITGAALGQGYLQRLAVDPATQGQGHGRQLTLDALQWMRRRRLASAVVNTSVDNGVALGLYESVGFRRLGDHLVVMQFELPGR